MGACLYPIGRTACWKRGKHDEALWRTLVTALLLPLLPFGAELRGAWTLKASFYCRVDGFSSRLVGVRRAGGALASCFDFGVRRSFGRRGHGLAWAVLDGDSRRHGSVIMARS